MPDDEEAEVVEVEDPELVGRLWLKAAGPIHVDLRTPPADDECSSPRVVFAREMALIAIYERIARISRSDLAGTEAAEPVRAAGTEPAAGGQAPVPVCGARDGRDGRE